MACELGDHYHVGDPQDFPFFFSGVAWVQLALKTKHYRDRYLQCCRVELVSSGFEYFYVTLNY